MFCTAAFEQVRSVCLPLYLPPPGFLQWHVQISFAISEAIIFKWYLLCIDSYLRTNRQIIVVIQYVRTFSKSDEGGIRNSQIWDRLAKTSREINPPATVLFSVMTWENMTKQYSNVNIDTDLTFKSIKSRFICGSYYRASFRASKKLVHHALTQFARGEKLKIDRENPIKKFHITPLPLPNIT